jgi:hypothetical protein
MSRLWRSQLCGVPFISLVGSPGRAKLDATYFSLGRAAQGTGCRFMAGFLGPWERQLWKSVRLYQWCAKTKTRRPAGLTEVEGTVLINVG